jgi:hypothetical protein
MYASKLIIIYARSTSGLPPAPFSVKDTHVMAQQEVVHQPLGQTYPQVFVAMLVDVPLHVIGTNAVKDAIGCLAEAVGVVETQLGLLSRGDEDRGGDIELKVELNCHGVNVLHPQSLAPERCEARALVQRAGQK